jgi:hypothetical protein
MIKAGKGDKLMKVMIWLGTMLVMVGLAACTSEPGKPGEELVPTPMRETGMPEKDKSSTNAWDKSPDAVLISATNCCGFVPTIYLQNALPDAQIWGDGRIVWVVYGETEARQVFEGRLSKTQIDSLLAEFEAAGFYTWDDLYQNPLVADYPTKCLAVSLAENAKQVCEYYEGAPEAFHKLYARLAGGAGAAGQPFTPERAYATSLRLDTSQGNISRVDLVWPVSATELSAFESGGWLDGEPLQIAWEAVNANPWGPVVQVDEAYYMLSIQVPGLSLESPPGN